MATSLTTRQSKRFSVPDVSEWASMVNYYASIRNIPIHCLGRSKFKTYDENKGTIANKKVYVAVSERGGLGLFAGCDFQRGDVVTEFGGTLSHRKEIDPEKTSHGRLLPDSGGYVRDGYNWALLFPRDLAQRESELKLLSLERNHILPHIPSSELDGKLAYELLLNEGVGYMCNTDIRNHYSNINTSIKTIFIPNNYPVQYVIANRSIKTGDELLQRYGNVFCREIQFRNRLTDDQTGDDQTGDDQTGNDQTGDDQPVITQPVINQSNEKKEVVIEQEELKIKKQNKEHEKVAILKQFAFKKSRKPVETLETIKKLKKNGILDLRF